MKNYLRYLYAALAVPLAVLLRFAFHPVIGTGIPYITLFPVTVAIALFAGLGPAILTGILGSIVMDYLFVEPLYTTEFSIGEFSRMAIVTLTSVFVGYVGDALRAARAKAEKQALTLRESQNDLNRAQAVADIGSWRLDVSKNELIWSDEAYRIFNVPKGTPLTYESFLAFVHPDDREYVDSKWKSAMAGEHYDIEHRIIVDGLTKWVHEMAELDFDTQRVLRGGFGIVQNITDRVRAEEELKKYRDELEIRIAERTKELTAEISERKKAEQTAKAERKRFEDVLEMMPAYAILLTPDYHVAYANRTFCNWFGDDKGKKCFEFLFNRTEPCENCETYKVLKTGKSHFWEWTGPNRRSYDIYDYPFMNTDGSPLIMEIGVDVTAHKKAQKAIREGEERYRSLTVATTQVVWTTDAQGRVVSDMPSWQAFTGQTTDDIQGWGWIESLHPDDRERTAEIWSQSVRSHSLYQTEYRLRRHDGEYRYVAVRGVPVIELDGSIREWIGTCTDITEQKRAEEKILADQEQLRSLTTELILTEERERRDVAAALHDSLGPLLAFSKRELGILQKSAPAKLLGTLDKIRDYISQAIDQTRALTFDLSPPTLYTLGLEHAIEELTERFSETGGIQCVFENSETIIPPSDDIKILLYRSMRELFVNITKHAQAKSVRVNLSMDGNNIKISVEDDGVGFDMTDIDPRTGKSSGFGLFSILQRLTQVGGRFDIKSEKGKGTKVILMAPLKSKKTRKGE